MKKKRIYVTVADAEQCPSFHAEHIVTLPAAPRSKSYGWVAHDVLIDSLVVLARGEELPLVFDPALSDLAAAIATGKAGSQNEPTIVLRKLSPRLDWAPDPIELSGLKFDEDMGSSTLYISSGSSGCAFSPNPTNGIAMLSDDKPLSFTLNGRAIPLFRLPKPNFRSPLGGSTAAIEERIMVDLWSENMAPVTAGFKGGYLEISEISTAKFSAQVRQ